MINSPKTTGKIRPKMTIELDLELETYFNEKREMEAHRPTRHSTMLGLAYVIAQRSTCKRRAVGCVLTDVNGRVLSMGHNGVAKGEKHCYSQPCEGVDCPSGTGLDLCRAIHAEQNALMFCPNVMKIHACYVTTEPCMHCVKMLMNTSCKEVHFVEKYFTESWRLWCGYDAAGNFVNETGRSWCYHGND